MDYYNTTSTPSSSNDTPETVAYFLAPVIFAAIVWAIGYFGIRVFKKRKPNERETRIIITISVVLTVLGIIGRLANNGSGNY